LANYLKENNRVFLKDFYRDVNSVPWLFNAVLGFNDPHDLHRYNVLLKQIAELPHSKVLEVGCGGGQLIQSLSGKSNIIGFDLSLNVLRRVASKNLKTTNLVAGDAVSLPFKETSFDIIVCTEVLEHVPRFDLVITEIERVISPDGFVLITVPNLWRYDSLDGRYKIVTRILSFVSSLSGQKDSYKFDGHIHKAFPWQWKKALEKEFEVIADYPVFIFPYIPGQIAFLRVLERKLFSSKFLKILLIFEKKLCRFWPFQYLGQTHAFTCIRLKKKVIN
jgi:ubiquinone/menaquinone biosynthesis C-methylase UbiE